MSFWKKFFGKNKTSKLFSNDELSSAGLCPNCWGSQSYDDKYIEFVEDHTKSNINKEHKGQKAFIQQFVEDHVSGIRLKNNTCEMCKRKFN